MYILYTCIYIYIYYTYTYIYTYIYIICVYCVCVCAHACNVRYVRAVDPGSKYDYTFY